VSLEPRRRHEPCALCRKQEKIKAKMPPREDAPCALSRVPGARKIQRQRRRERNKEAMRLEPCAGSKKNTETKKP